MWEIEKKKKVPPPPPPRVVVKPPPPPPPKPPVEVDYRPADALKLVSPEVKFANVRRARLIATDIERLPQRYEFAKAELKAIEGDIKRLEKELEEEEKLPKPRKEVIEELREEKERLSREKAEVEDKLESLERRKKTYHRRVEKFKADMGVTPFVRATRTGIVTVGWHVPNTLYVRDVTVDVPREILTKTYENFKITPLTLPQQYGYMVSSLAHQLGINRDETLRRYGTTLIKYDPEKIGYWEHYRKVKEEVGK